MVLPVNLIFIQTTLTQIYSSSHTTFTRLILHNRSLVLNSIFIRLSQAWSDVTPLTFRRVTGNAPAYIVITFDSGDHNDGNPFDGPRGVLAHVYFPENGDAHFDEAELWTINTSAGEFEDSCWKSQYFNIKQSSVV